MSRASIIGWVIAASIVGSVMWASNKIDQLSPKPVSEAAFAEQQVANLEASAKRNGLSLGKSHAQLVAEEIAQDRKFREHMANMKQMGDELEVADAQQQQATHDRQCAAGLKSAC